ncbi:hypothetical protein B0I35DRAFT_478552 [Stachybotrys elegans]|uniref:SWIM-type domain-containing protein n=1 Tax=Stachybotrys elegans TaxID=80388 RepID=A0A8K0SXD4_9HYPO|nr:hypothetical protein B0I35DRAFT_478552 [Stachybotrys elegans]
MKPLPSQRRLLTSLIDSLSTAPSSTPDLSTHQTHGASRRQLLLTLHVIFPLLLLPALDLLDRHLVTRLTLRNADPAVTSDVFVVRSLASTLSSRRRDAMASSVKSYVVRLGAWNCSCANFAVEAFPARPSGRITSDDETLGEPEHEPHSNWSFGGMSLDGLGGLAGGVPCCKHLLACLLAHRCHETLGRHAEDRIVTREELAEIMADT